ncbi:hypothetical protein Tco_1121429 [Tanacetum coccineum]|uniref:Uncharacterized protein n=1 Tax=Tanacetum coccineum TaxID=301880 RepID=A0ABQ5IXV9_9ASTR
MVGSTVGGERVSVFLSFVVVLGKIFLRPVETFYSIIQSSVSFYFSCFNSSVSLLHQTLVSGWESVERNYTKLLVLTGLTTPSGKPPTVPKEKKEKKSGKGKQKTTELETISEADLTEAEQLKIITKRSRQETHSSHASGSGADEGTGVTPGVPDAPDYDSEDDISWKSSDDDQDDEKAQDDEDEDKNDVNETTQDDEDDDEHDDDEKAQDDDDEEQTESEDDGDDFIHPKLTTHDDEIIHEEETDEDDSFDPTIHTPSHISSSDEEDSNNEIEGTNVEGAKSDEDATYEEDQGNEAVEDTNTNLDGRDDVMTDVILPQVSSGFVSNMLNPNQDTGVDDIFGQHTEATSLIDTPVTAIVEPSFSAPTNRPPTPNPLDSNTYYNFDYRTTTTSSSLQNLPNFASFTVDQYLANKMQEAVDVAVQLKYERIREESTTANQQFLDSIDDGMKKIIKEQVKKEVSKIILVENANLSELELKKILIEQVGSKQSINRPREVPMMIKNPPLETDGGPKEEDQSCTGTLVHDEQAEEEIQHLPDWFQQPTRLPSPDHAWNKSVPAAHESVQPWLSNLAHQDPRESRSTLPTTEKLDWINPEGRQYPHDLRQPLPLVPNSQGRRVIPFHHFINNDLEYLRGGVSSRKYSTSVTKTTAADYGHIKWDRKLSSNSMWSQTIVKYDKFALWGISHWGKKRRQFYAFATLMESARDVYSKRRIIAVTKVEIVEWA